jgi:anthranilate synthase/aminodeoxychorismate synthase-like glutamine amidotransferase
MRIVIIDNYDSFTYNLYQSIGQLGIQAVVIRNDRITINGLKKLKPHKIIISPGPKTPAEAGISNKVVKYFSGKVPILGVCLGHQCIGEVFGADVKPADKVVHGKTSLIYHDSKTIFKNIKNPFLAARYHSLVVENPPDCLEVSAATADNIIMGLRHRKKLVEGIQFHPESFMTNRGIDIIRNFVFNENLRYV